MVGLLIEDVTLIKQRQVTAAVRFRGGATTTLTQPRPLTAQQLRATDDDVRRQIDVLLDEYTDAQVARVLNERTLHTGGGDAFDGGSVQWVRLAHRLKSLKQRLLESGWLTRRETSSRLRGDTIDARKVAPGRTCQGAYLQRQWRGCSGRRRTGRPPPRAPRTWSTTAPLREVQYEACSFAVDVLACPRCHGRMRLLALVQDPANVARFLAGLGEATDLPRRSPGRGPPYGKSRVLRGRALGKEDGGQGRGVQETA